MASQPVATCIVFASRPSGKRLRISGSSGRPFRDLAEGEVLLQTLYLSLAPYMRDRKDNANSCQNDNSLLLNRDRRSRLFRAGRKVRDRGPLPPPSVGLLIDPVTLRERHQAS
ncbi:hypothetical protein RLV_1820 (plasmid) [Rhizobium leguminosarum bv. viciae]|nr:hypothetical protein RLV_1820 [Rhizobium leguminosarum bv. viciae]